MSSVTYLDKLSFKEQVFTFLSIIHPEGKAGAEQVFADYDLLEENEEEGNPDRWLFNLYVMHLYAEMSAEEMNTEGDCVLYVLSCEYIDADKEADDSMLIVSDMERMAAARDCQIDWGGDANDRTFRLALGMDGLLATAGRSLWAQGYNLWRDKSPSRMQSPDGFEQYCGWISKSADDEALQALCASLNVSVERLG